MNKEEAIQILSTRDAHGVLCGYTSRVTEALDMAIEALSVPQTDAVDCTDFIEWLVDRVLDETIWENNSVAYGEIICRKLVKIGALATTEKPPYYYVPSADAVHGWRVGKPTEQGKYMVTLDSFGHKHIDLFYYGKPMMPNRKVRGKCWYRSDDEWGDVVYDDTDILAWMPLPKPYGERRQP